MIPCNLVAGPLGVGKTTAILNYLRRHASSQRVGVLVNDFGPVGLDSTTLAAEAPGTKVLNVPGGCICCTMLAELPDRIGRLVSDEGVDRLIIEPSGMAAPSQVVDLLRANQRELGIDLRPAIVMLSAVDFDEETFARMPYYHVFSEAADVLVFNRSDQAGEAKTKRAVQWGAELDPPKLRVLSTSHGELPSEVFDLSCEGCGHDHGHQHGHDHGHPHGHDHGDGHEHSHDHDHEHHHHDHDHDPAVRPGGFVLDAERQFDEQVLLVNLMRVCHAGVDGNEVLRLKGVFHTHDDWWSIEIANREVTYRQSAYRRDSRMEWISRPGVIDQEQMLLEIARPLDWQEIAGSLEEG
ncbi:MAG: GTP-binding protein [Planctomycetota bacterium]